MEKKNRQRPPPITIPKRSAGLTIDEVGRSLDLRDREREEVVEEEEFSIPQGGKDKRRYKRPFYLKKRGKAVRRAPKIAGVEIHAATALIVDIGLLDPIIEQNKKLEEGRDQGRFTLGPEQSTNFGKKRRRKKKKK